MSQDHPSLQELALPASLLLLSSRLHSNGGGSGGVKRIEDESIPSLADSAQLLGPPGRPAKTKGEGSGDAAAGGVPEGEAAAAAEATGSDGGNLGAVLWFVIACGALRHVLANPRPCTHPRPPMRTAHTHPPRTLDHSRLEH